MVTDVSRFRCFLMSSGPFLSPLFPSNQVKVGCPFGEHRHVDEGILYRTRIGLHGEMYHARPFGPRQTVWQRHVRYASRMAPGLLSWL